MKAKFVTAFIPAGTVEICDRGRTEQFYLNSLAILEEKFGNNLSVYCSAQAVAGRKPWGIVEMRELLGGDVVDLCEKVRIAAPTGCIRVDNRLFSAVMHSKIQLLAKELRDDPDLTHVYWIDAGIAFSGGRKNVHKFNTAGPILRGLDKFNAPHSFWMKDWGNHERGEVIEHWVPGTLAVAGTSFGGDRESVLRVADLYREVLMENLKAGLHTVDEDILTIIHVRNPGLIRLHSFDKYFSTITRHIIVRGHVIDMVTKPRWGKECVDILGAHGIDATLFPGVDGHTCDPSEMPEIHRWSRAYPTPGEVGCFASHANLANAIMAGTVEPVLDAFPDWWLIFEDDAIPRGGMNAGVVAFAVAEADKAGFRQVLLHQGAYIRPPRGPCRVVPRSPAHRAAHLHAYLLHREAAAKIAGWEMYAAIDTAIARSDIPVGVLVGGAGFTQRNPRHAPFSLYYERRAARRR